MTVDINRFRKKYKREDLKDKGYKWAYSRSKGYYIGTKLVLAISLDKIHRFILPSVTNITSLGVVLIDIAISLGFRYKVSLQRLVEW